MTAIQDGRVPTFIVLGKCMKYIEFVLESTPKLRIFITGETLKCMKLDVGPLIEPSGHLLVKVTLYLQMTDLFSFSLSLIALLFFSMCNSYIIYLLRAYIVSLWLILVVANS